MSRNVWTMFSDAVARFGERTAVEILREDGTETFTYRQLHDLASCRAARLAASGPSMIVSDFETRVGTRWTIDTLRALVARHPGVRFVWLMGSDNLAGFHRWRGWTDIMRLMPMAVIARPGSLLDSRTAPAASRFAGARLPQERARMLPDMEAPAWAYLTAPLNHRSSTALRAAGTRDARAGS